jgi:DNA-binding Xre family transcriptional regulator
MTLETSTRSPLAHQPVFPVATYTDEYGDTRIIHAERGKGGKLRRLKGMDTPAGLLNRAIAILLGRRVRERRLHLGLTMPEVAKRAGLASASPKQYIYHIETAHRREGVRLGTLFALAHALECEPADLLPSAAEAMNLASVKPATSDTLAVL